MVGIVAGLSVGSSAFAPRRRDRMKSSACCLSVGTPAKYIKSTSTEHVKDVFDSMHASSILTFIGCILLEGILTNSTSQRCPCSLILLRFITVTRRFILDLYWDNNRPGSPLGVATFWAV